MAIGIVNAGVRNDADPALAILSEQLESTEPLQKIAAITGYLLCLWMQYQ